MKKLGIANLLLSIVIVPLLAVAPHQAQSKQAAVKTLDLSPSKPESLGFSQERLKRLHALMQESVDRKQVSGIVTILARRGKVVDYAAYGVKDFKTGQPMTKDAIFRDFSMTKPVTAVAMMILYEQGKWLPSDPIAKFIPEFAGLKVYKGLDQDGKMILEAPAHAPNMRELMTHTAGFSYGFFGNTPVDQMYRDERVLQSDTLQQMIDKLARIPLLYQPGKGWTYSVAMDIQGYIIEKLSGQSLPDFMEQHIFKPLGMRDAGFYVPQEKRSRFVTLYRGNEKNELVVVDAMPGFEYTKQPTMASGGGGMVSTAEDYFRFAQMLSNGGELGGVRILAPSSVRLMSANHVPASLLTGEYGIGPHILRPGFGYGYNVAVVYDPAEANLPEGKGTFFWDGAAGTWFWVDPTNEIVFVGMIQRLFGPGSPNLEYLSRSLVYQALVDPKM